MLATAVSCFVAVFAALFPVINPLGDAPIFLNMVQGCSQEVKNRLARQVSINCFFLLSASMLIGPQLLLFFGVSLPALKLAGGAVVIALGWNLLNQKSTSDKDTSKSVGITDETADNSAFFPLTMPLTAGPGSIATAIALVAAYQEKIEFTFANEIPSLLGTFLALVALSVTVYLIYRESSVILRFLGANGTNVVMRLFAFILLAIGVQIFLGGINGFGLEFSKLLPAH